MSLFSENLPQPLGTGDSPTFANVIITAGNSVKPTANTTLNVAYTGGTPFVTFDFRQTAADNWGTTFLGSWTQTSGANGCMRVTPTYNQTSGTAANTDLQLYRAQTAVGSGAQLGLDLGVGSSSWYKFAYGNTATTGAFNAGSGTVDAVSFASILDFPAGSTATLNVLGVDTVNTAVQAGNAVNLLNLKYGGTSVLTAQRTGQVCVGGVPTATTSVLEVKGAVKTNSTGIDIRSLGTATIGIDLSNSGLSGSDNLLYFASQARLDALGQFFGTNVSVDDVYPYWGGEPLRLHGKASNAASAIGLKLCNNTALTAGRDRWIAAFYNDNYTTVKSYVNSQGEFEILGNGLGYICRSLNGTKYLINVTDAGVVQATAI